MTNLYVAIMLCFVILLFQDSCDFFKKSWKECTDAVIYVTEKVLCDTTKWMKCKLKAIALKKNFQKPGFFLNRTEEFFSILSVYWFVWSQHDPLLSIVRLTTLEAITNNTTGVLPKSFHLTISVLSFVSRCSHLSCRSRRFDCLLLVFFRRWGRLVTQYHLFHAGGLLSFRWSNLQGFRTTLCRSTTGRYCSVAFIWMVTL